MNAFRAFLIALIISCAILSLVSISETARRSKSSNKSRRQQRLSETSSRKESTKLKQADGGGDEVVSKAFGFTSGGLDVNERTGSHTFEIPISSITHHHRQLPIKLRYDDFNALPKQGFFWFSVGWNVALPYMLFEEDSSSRPIHKLVLGDGSYYVLRLPSTGQPENGTSGLLYYERRNVHVETDGFDFKLTKDGDSFYFASDRAYMYKMVTREGYTVTVSMPSVHRLEIQNGTDTVFSMELDTATSNIHIRSETSMGTVHYEAQEKMFWVTCRSCENAANFTYNFEYNFAGKITRVQYPTGLIEEIGHDCIYSLFTRQCSGQYRVANVTRLPGANANMKGSVEHAGVTMVTTYNYKSPYVDPEEPYHPNYIGEPINLATAHLGEDRLMEAPDQGTSTYYYWVTVSDGYLCKRHRYNKMHLKEETVEGFCDLTHTDTISNDQVMKTSRYRYPCATDISFTRMAKECTQSVVYDKPIETAITTHDGDKNFTRTTVHHYNELGEEIYTRQPDGQTTNTTYGGSLSYGAFRYAVEVIHSPAFDGDKLPLHITRHEYANITQFDSPNEMYEVKVVESKNFLLPHDDRIQLVKKTITTYYNGSGLTDPMTHGLMASEVQYATGSKPMRVEMSYSFSNAKVRIAAKKSAPEEPSLLDMTSSAVHDAATGINLQTEMFDHNLIVNEYDSLARPVLLSHQSAGLPPQAVNLTATYTLSEGSNEVRVTLPNGQVVAHLFDNAGRRLGRQVIVGNGARLPTEAMLYNEQGRVWQTIDYAATKLESDTDTNNDGGWDAASMQQTRSQSVFDPLGRITNSVDQATGVDSRTIYSVLHDEGEILLSYKVSKRGKWCCGTCKVTNAAGLETRSGQLLSNFHLAVRYYCDGRDTLSFTETTYDGYGRVSEQRTWATRKHKLLSKTAVFYSPVGYKELEMIGSSGTWESNVTYLHENMTGQVTALVLEGRTLASRTVDSFGRIQTLSFAPVEIRNRYNNFGQADRQEINLDNVQMVYDGFGRLTQSKSESQSSGRIINDFTYDAFGRPLNVASQTYANDDQLSAKSHKSHRYDPIMSKLEEITHQFSSGTDELTDEKKMQWTHDSSGRILQSVDFNGLKTVYAYNRDTSKLAGQDTFVNDTQTQAIKYSYDDYGMPNSIHVHNLKLVQHVATGIYYDSYQRVNTIAHWQIVGPGDHWVQIGLLWYAYDNFGRIESKETPSTLESYAYDCLGQLIQYTCKQLNENVTDILHQTRCPPFSNDLDVLDDTRYIKEQQFSYDNIMRQLTATVLTSNDGQLVAINRVYDVDKPMELREINYVTDGKVTKYTVEHDNQGSIQSIHRSDINDYYNFKYDALRRPTALKRSSLQTANVRKAYDESGNQFLERSDTESGTQWLHYSDSGELIGTVRGSNHASCSYISLLKKTSSRVCSNASSDEEMLLDAMGSKIGSIDSTGAVHWNAYTPFGDRIVKTNSSLPNIGFHNIPGDTMKFLVAKNGRHYAPFLYQFLQRDPLSPFDGGGINPYSYASNSPVQLGDPSGNVFKALSRFVIRVTLRLGAGRSTSLSTVSTQSTSLDSLASVRPAAAPAAAGSSRAASEFSWHATEWETATEHSTHTALANDKLPRGMYSSDDFTELDAIGNAGETYHCVSRAFTAAVKQVGKQGKPFMVKASVLRKMVSKTRLHLYGRELCGTTKASMRTALPEFTMNEMGLTEIEEMSTTTNAARYTAVTKEEVMAKLNEHPGRPGILFLMRDRQMMRATGQGVPDVAIGEAQDVGHALYYNRVDNAVKVWAEEVHVESGIAGPQATTMNYFPTQQQLQRPGVVYMAYKKLEFAFVYRM